jgi:hypothetical protein
MPRRPKRVKIRNMNMIASVRGWTAWRRDEIIFLIPGRALMLLRGLKTLNTLSLPKSV